jgi:hypothetical protein
MRKANDWQTLMTKTGTVLILSSACGGIRRERAKGTSSYTRRIIALQGFSLKAPSREMSPPSCYHDPDPPSNLGIKTEISRLWSIPDHQQGIRCKAPRSDD